MVFQAREDDSSDNDSSPEGQQQRDSSDDSDDSSSNASNNDEEEERQPKKAASKSSDDSDEDEEVPEPKKKLAPDSSDSNASSPARPGTKSPDSSKSSDKEDSDNEVGEKGDQKDKSDEEEDAPVVKTKTDEIFGNALTSSDEEEGEDKKGKTEPTDEDSQRRLEAMRQLSASSDEEEGPRRQIMELRDSYPKMNINLGNTEPVFFRPPNFLSIEPKPFNSHPEAYQREVDDDEIIDEEGRARLKLRIENTIRWRWVKDPKTGEYKKQSNAKIVKWSDGTMSMYLGSEIFEVQKQDCMPNMHLYTRVGPALQAQKVFKSKYTFRPHSTDTVTHRKLTMNMADKSNKGPKVKMFTEVGMNPEQQRKEMVKKEEESLRAAARRSAQQRKVRERAREVGLTSGFIEGDDSGDDNDIGAIKKSFKHRSGYNNPYYSDDSEEDERSRKVLREAKIIDSDSDDNDASTSKKERKKHRILESDDEDDD
ncbi:unnamed protein product [Bursaphelenchus okinawaensis]|uniref:RNA polymerase-associated protein LEO1 n=1 Tax=Bursaphelenchus okinawaensis TaxID=465554 RepID=A0A811LLG6_9BILA|nr:unnamed protein product [Bursaphelenchus okinawaensis]CAG9123610.1 unnamed protein product [Bursaphelenchus okinawaensis]